MSQPQPWFFNSSRSDLPEVPEGRIFVSRHPPPQSARLPPMAPRQDIKKIQKLRKLTSVILELLGSTALIVGNYYGLLYFEAPIHSHIYFTVARLFYFGFLACSMPFWRMAETVFVLRALSTVLELGFVWSGGWEKSKTNGVVMASFVGITIGVLLVEVLLHLVYLWAHRKPNINVTPAPPATVSR